jgi:DNA-binding transcriptional MerR regulator
MRIGAISEATGVSTRSLRYYEEQGLIQSVRRMNGYRDYNKNTVETVQFIQDLFAAGLSSTQIRDIILYISGRQSDGDCSHLLAQVRQARDRLAAQEESCRARRELLEKYLSGQMVPRGMPNAGGISRSLC